MYVCFGVHRMILNFLDHSISFFFDRELMLRAGGPRNSFFPLRFAWMLDSRRYDIATFSFAYLLLFQFVHRVISWKYFCSFFFAKTSRIERRKGVVFLSSIKIMMKKKTYHISTKLTFLMLLLKMLYIFFCFDIYSFLKELAKIVWYPFRRASNELTWLKSR